MFDELSTLYQFRKNLKLDPKILEEIQRKKLKSIIKHAYDNIPFYHVKFKELNIRPDDIKTLTDISKIPFTTKSEIQKNYPDKIIARNVDPKKCSIRRTSGSQGQPLSVFVDERAANIDNAMWHRALFENGLTIFDKMAVLPNPHRLHQSKRWFQNLGIMRRKYVSVLDKPEIQIKILNEYNPDIIKTYPSYLSTLIYQCKKSDIIVHPKSIYTTSELINDDIRYLIEKSFNSEIYDYYSSEEFTLIAWECKRHNGYHINSDNLVVEIIKDDEYSVLDEEGEIVCTSLNNYAMPLIRYKIGDIGIMSNNVCNCGVKLPMLKMIQGRTDDYLTATDGRIISPRAISDVFTYDYIYDAGIVQFRIIQNEINSLKINIITNEKFNINNLELIKKEFLTVLGKDMQIKFILNKNIKNKSKIKLRKIISKVPIKF